MANSAAARGWLGPVKDRAPSRPVRVSKAPDMTNSGYHEGALDDVDSLP
jgi:hypothetical protein